MHVGYATLFQNPASARSDREVWQREVSMAVRAEALGFDSVWTVEHHFTDYTMSPDPLQFLTYVAARTERVQLGTMVAVLPWHDPVRLAEQVSLLDHLSDGRAILGIGRGLGRVEFDGFRVPMDESRERFVECAELVLKALEDGYIEGGERFRQPRRDIRPRPFATFKGRTYAAAVSPESMAIMARLGVGILIIPQKGWDGVRKDLDDYRAAWAEVNPDTAPPQPLCGAFVFVDEDEDRALELGRRYAGAYYESAMAHYEMTSPEFGTAKGYEYYGKFNRFIERLGAGGAADAFADLMPIGTPEQVLEKLRFIRDVIDNRGVMVHTSYAGMPWDEAERNLALFAEACLPELRSWDTTPRWHAASAAGR